MFTWLFSLSLLSSPANAGEFFLSATPDQVPSGRDVGGLNWIRVFNNFDDGGWWMTHHFEMSGVPGYNAAPMTEGLEVDMTEYPGQPPLALLPPGTGDAERERFAQAFVAKVSDGFATWGGAPHVVSGMRCCSCWKPAVRRA